MDRIVNGGAVAGGGQNVALPAGGDRSTFAYLVLLGLGVLDAAAYSIIAPVAPTIAAQTGAGPILIGVLVASFPLGVMLGFVAAGVGVRRRRHSLVLLVSLGLLALGSLAFALAPGIPAYVAARVVMGLGSGGLWMGITFSTLARWPGQEYLCMSRIFAAYSVGGLLGPALGAMGGIREPFLAYFTLVVAAAALVLLMGSPHQPRAFDADRSVLRLPAFRLASAGILFAVLALGIVEGVLPLHLAERLTQLQIGILYAAMSLLVAVAATFAARFDPRRLLLGATAFVVIGIGAVGALVGLPIWIVGLGMAGIGIGMANTGSIGILLAGIPTDRSVTAIIVWSQVGIVGYLIGPLLGGPVAEVFGFRYLGAILLLAALPIALMSLRNGPRRRAPD